MDGICGPSADLRERTILAAGGTPAKARALRHLGFDIRPTNPRNVTAPAVTEARQAFWARPIDPPPADPMIRQCMVAYLSDAMLLSTALLPHGIHWFSTRMDWASLNHSLWLHRIPTFDDWLLWNMTCWWSGGARALVRGEVFERDGTLVASVAQEGLARIR